MDVGEVEKGSVCEDSGTLDRSVTSGPQTVLAIWRRQRDGLGGFATAHGGMMCERSFAHPTHVPVGMWWGLDVFRTMGNEIRRGIPSFFVPRARSHPSFPLLPKPEQPFELLTHAFGPQWHLVQRPGSLAREHTTCMSFERVLLVSSEEDEDADACEENEDREHDYEDDEARRGACNLGYIVIWER